MKIPHFIVFVLFWNGVSVAQTDSSLLTLERIYSGEEFRQDRMPSFTWMRGGNAYLVVEPVPGEEGQRVIKYNTEDGSSDIILDRLSMKQGQNRIPVHIESISLSRDESKLLLFTESRRVWRSNTKGEYIVYNMIPPEVRKSRPGIKEPSIRRLGRGLPPSSLMFAKFSPNNEKVCYVSDFNLFIEDFKSGQIDQLTTDGDGDIINGTFDWVYEEEFGCRDGFRWSPDSKKIAFWQLDASEIGTHYMINNTDSVYADLIPLQYPKVGYDPSSCRVGLIDIITGQKEWIPIPGDIIQNYIPRMQWIRNDLLLIQQINRKQNHLIYWNYNPFTKQLKKVYEEKEDTWVDIDYPDASSSAWGMYDLSLIDKIWVTRMTETDGWRHIYKVNLDTGEKRLLTPGDYDVASTYGHDGSYLYFSASPSNSTQRYLWKVDVNGNDAPVRITPKRYSGMNTYRFAPNGRYAFHTHSNAQTPPTTHLIRTEDHGLIRTYVDNADFKQEMDQLNTGEIRFFQVTTEDGIEIDGRMILPPDFNESMSYPVLFHVYGEPWGQVAQDRWVGLWDRFMAQQGYIIIDMDNRGTPCLKGSEWRKSIYRKIGVLNTNDQAAAAREVFKWPFIDENRTAVWGWSGGGSMTLNLLFRHPEIYSTGVSIAPVGNQLLYDNIYQERYMGLPSENLEDFVEGSPKTYAHQLEGNLLLIHGTGDDNVHYQNAEVIVDELIKHNKSFDMMAYPNRSHGISEGENTRKHLYHLITRYINEHVRPGPERMDIRP